MSTIDKPLVNRVANSGIITIDLEQYYPAEPVVAFDLKDYLYMELILKEKDFRAALKEHDWTQYDGKRLAVYCSADAIIPTWAYMLVTSMAQPHAVSVDYGTPDEVVRMHYQQALSAIEGTDYTDKRVVIKGCSDKPVPASAYVALSARLRPHVKSLMFGEPCSMVPIYKQPRK